MAEATNFHRLVHLDLKGAPPKLQYILSLLPLFKRCGATGLLVEYENTFPYKGELEILAAPWAYSMNEISQLQNSCEQLSLEIIPLVQTFGHAEFILHHKKFQHLREDPDYPNCFCPSRSETLLLIESMLQQVLDAHPTVSTFHIGCDEVSPIGMCPICVERLETSDKTKLYLEHMSKVAITLKKRRPQLSVIVWDDMIRNIPTEVTQGLDLCSLVEPMVWYYGVESVPDVFATYAKLFPRVWCASAYKGASGCSETLPNLALHIGNTKLWHSVLHDLATNGVTVAGIALTGWSRYDYFGVLCDLLPAGVPSLVMCLRILASGNGWSQAVHLDASRLLGMDHCIPIDWHPRPKPTIMDARFPGDLVFVGSQHHANLYNRFLQFVNSSLYRGWLNKYNLRRGYAHVGTVRQLGMEAQRLQRDFMELKETMFPSMAEIYAMPILEEWFGQHIELYVEELGDVVNKCASVVNS